MRQKAAFMTALERRITIRLKHKNWVDLVEYAEREGVAASALVRDLVEDFLQTQKKKRAGLRRVK